MGLFSRPRRETVVLIDVGARSVSGACAHYVGSEIPVVVYTTLVPIEIVESEEPAQAMLRALETLCTALKSEGVAALLRATGDHAIDATVVSLDAPWQETVIHTKKITQEKDFIFTKGQVASVLREVSQPVAGKRYTDVSVVGTVLNGYEARLPYGRRAHTASVIVLTSCMDAQVASDVHAVLASMSHTKRVVLIAGTSLRYQAIRVAFQHEHDALVVDATSPLLEVALIRKGFLVATSETPESLAVAGTVQPGDFMRAFADIARQYPLPHTVFLLTRFDQAEEVQAVLKAANLSALWLSENPPKIVPLLASHMNGLVRQMTTNPPDLPLLLMALYYRYLTEPL